MTINAEAIAAIIDPAAFDIRRSLWRTASHDDPSRVKRRRIASKKAEKILKLMEEARHG